jgi:hypothetical protein
LLSRSSFLLFLFPSSFSSLAKTHTPRLGGGAGAPSKPARRRRAAPGRSAARHRPAGSASATLPADARHRIAAISDHYIRIAQPALVAEAIRAVIDAVRAPVLSED